MEAVHKTVTIHIRDNLFTPPSLNIAEGNGKFSPAREPLPVRDRMGLRGRQGLQIGDRRVREHLQAERAQTHPVALLDLADGERGHRAGASTRAEASARSSAGMRKPISSTAFSTVNTVAVSHAEPTSGNAIPSSTTAT